MKALALIFCCLMLAAVAFAVSGPPSPAVHSRTPGGALDQVWGPDAYGYVARDNHETNGPTFAWMDISTTGTLVQGLGDDNTSLPLPIGFNFHYYWYDVNQFWVGSNGYITFQPGVTYASPFHTLPTDTLPANLIAPFAADWIEGGAEPGHVYYEMRGGDSLIVMWKSVRAWAPAPGGPVGNHNFEVILSRLDSSVTIQIGALTANDLYTTDLAVGMDNVTGLVGIGNFIDTYPPANTAIKFYYPASTTYVAHDVGIAGTQNLSSGGIFLVQGDTLHPQVFVRNVGNQTETGFHSLFSVRTLNNVLLTSADSLCGTLNPGQVQNVAYPNIWIAGAPAVYRMTGRTNLTGDANHNNDSVRVQIHTLTLPGELYYDDNSAEQGWSWAGGDGGMANQFVSPVYPCRITQLNYYIYSFTAGGLGFTAQVYRDSAGMPGSLLWSQAVTNPATADWTPVTVNPPLQIDSGAFYLAWMQLDSLCQFGVDNNATQGSSRRGWEYSNVWAEFRLGQISNPMIRCTVDAVGVVNHPPSITAHTPQSLVDTVGQNETVHFSVTASDPDGDSLRFRWTRGGVQVGTAFSADIPFPDLGPVVVKCVVSDGLLADSVMWNITVGELAVGDNGASLPKVFALREAYPNPFNPSTSLAYDIARDGDVSLKIYDLLGNEVATLVNGRLSAGTYRVSWNAASQPSGTYFAVLTSSSARLVQKLLLMK